jgi:hypothetical protein
MSIMYIEIREKPTLILCYHSFAEILRFNGRFPGRYRVIFDPDNRKLRSHLVPRIHSIYHPAKIDFE